MYLHVCGCVYICMHVCMYVGRYVHNVCVCVCTVLYKKFAQVCKHFTKVHKQFTKLICTLCPNILKFNSMYKPIA